MAKVHGSSNMLMNKLQATGCGIEAESAAAILYLLLKTLCSLHLMNLQRLQRKARTIAG